MAGTARKRKRKGRAGLLDRRPRAWPVQEARAQLSRLLDEAAAGRPQRISRHGETVAVLVSAADFEQQKAPKGNLLDFFRNSPLAKYRETHDLEFERNRNSRLRRIDFER